ncbi:MAG: MerR family transcriptional regulator [Zetaproteobacteria bacterium]|nr:MAG: MerR family transcriptional regulator [Zetaproteobacteria bacterium]
MARRLLRAGVPLPDLEEKVFFSISEVSEICRVEPHVLRYWETEFHQLRPEKWGGNRRRYRRRDVYLVLLIRHLLHTMNFTIRGARKQLARSDAAPLYGVGIRRRLRLLRGMLLDARAMLEV